MNQRSFSIEFGKLMSQKDITRPQLARKSGKSAKTLRNWLDGAIPRFWQPIVEVGRTLDLTLSEMNMLLALAGKSSISELKQAVSKSDEIALLGYWQGPFLAPSAPDVVVGRDETTTQAITVLTRTIPPNSREKRICMLQGMGGVGKTTLAKQIAHLAREQFVDGVLWADLQEDTPDRLTAVLMQFGHACGLDLPKKLSLDVLSQRVQASLRGKQMLIVLDDVQTGQQIDHIWPGGDDGALLLTARPRTIRTPLGTERIQLMSFDPKTTATLDLFREYLGQQRVEHEIDAFAEIADLIDHLPLAATIVARRLAVDPDWSAAEFLDEELRPEHNRLTALQHDDLSVRLSFNVSYQSLPPPRQRQFAELGVFEGQPFSMDAAAHILELPLRKTKSFLRDLSHLALIQRVQENKFQLHLLLSQYAYDYLSGKAVYARKVRYYVDYAHKNRYDDRTLFSEMDNIRLSLHHAYEQNIERDFAQGVATTYHFLFEYGLYDTVDTYLEQALTIARQNNDAQITSRLLTGKAHVAIRRNRRSAAETFIQEAEALSEGEARVILGRVKGEIKVYQNVEEALAILRDTIVLARQYNQADELSILCYSAASFHLNLGQSEDAEQFIDEALQITAESDNLRLRGKLLKLQGSVAQNKGKYRLAESYYEQALNVAHKVKNPGDLLSLYNYYGYLLRLQGRNVAALNYYELAMEKAINLSEPYPQIYVWTNMAATLIEQGDFTRAKSCLQQGRALSEQMEGHVGKPFLLVTEGHLTLRGAKDGKKALKIFTEALSIAEMSGDAEQMINVHIALGHVALEQNREDTAETHFTAAFNQATEGQYAAETELSRYGLARVEYARDKRESAIEIATQTHTHLKEMGHYQAKQVEVWLRQAKNQSSK